MDPKLRRAIETQLEYMCAAICAFVLLVTFALAAAAFTVSARTPEPLAWGVLVFPASGILFAGGFQALTELLRRMYAYRPSRTTRKRELFVWIVSPVAGALTGLAMGLLYHPTT